MATAREYAYYIEGSRIAIIERDYTSTDGVNYTYTNGGGLDIPSGTGSWKSPVASVSDGIQLEYTILPKAKDGGAIEDESDDIDISNYLSKAIVLYVKGKLAEDRGEIDMKEYFMKEFRKMIEKQDSARMSGPRVLSSGMNAIR